MMVCLFVLEQMSKNNRLAIKPKLFLAMRTAPCAPKTCQVPSWAASIAIAVMSSVSTAFTGEKKESAASLFP
jgi:hypothetical protein